MSFIAFIIILILLLINRPSDKKLIISHSYIKCLNKLTGSVYIVVLIHFERFDLINYPQKSTPIYELIAFVYRCKHGIVNHETQNPQRVLKILQMNFANPFAQSHFCHHKHNKIVAESTIYIIRSMFKPPPPRSSFKPHSGDIRAAGIPTKTERETCGPSVPRLSRSIIITLRTGQCT